MTRAFKFVRPDDAHFLNEKRIKLGSFAGYKSLEDKRADELDGALKIVMESTHVADSNEPGGAEVLAAARYLGIEVGRAINCTFGGTMIRRVPNMAVFCMSRHPVNRHWAALGLTEVFEIPDVAKFATWIVHSYAHRLISAHGEPVRYGRREFDAFDANIPPANPYVKREEFSPEDEFRICWRVRPGCPLPLIASLFGAPDLIVPWRAS